MTSRSVFAEVGLVHIEMVLEKSKDPWISLEGRIERGFLAGS